MAYLRIACAQFALRNIRSFEEFAEHVEETVAKAANATAQMVCFHVYFSTELLSAFKEDGHAGIVRLSTEST